MHARTNSPINLYSSERLRLFYVAIISLLCVFWCLCMHPGLTHIRQVSALLINHVPIPVIYYCYYFMGLRIDPKASGMPGGCSTTELCH
jgi:hypothetical protein